MLGGAGVQMHAISTLKSNRRLLKKKKAEVFNSELKNKFINAPILNWKISKSDFINLQAIKIEKSNRNKKLKMLINLLIVSLIILTALITLIFS